MRPESKGRTCGCTQGSTSTSKGGENSKAMVILVWKYHKKPLLFGLFFSLQCLSSTHQFMTDIFTLRFFRCSIYIKKWSLPNNTSAMVIVFRIMLNEPFSCPTVSSSKKSGIKVPDLNPLHNLNLCSEIWALHQFCVSLNFFPVPSVTSTAWKPVRHGHWIYTELFSSW